ncbi:hypothetical protein QUF70_09615 [Desulfobacterales bacterium HSG17]|nr:hypothetical protein [Desulfobacterales bacterium HSG17]
MFKDFSDPKMIKKSFAWIKKNLDPLMSYIIFENNLNKQPDSIFSESLTAYQYLKKENYAWKKVYDSKTSKEYLLIQIESGNEDEELGKVIGYGFPIDTVYYLYKAEKQL